MIRVLFVVQVSDTSYKRMVTSCVCPLDRFFLSTEGTKHVVRVVFDYIIVNG